MKHQRINLRWSHVAVFASMALCVWSGNALAQDDKLREGNVVQTIELPRDSNASQCQDLCNNNSRCWAWNYIGGREAFRLPRQPCIPSGGRTCPEAPQPKDVPASCQLLSDVGILKDCPKAPFGLPSSPCVTGIRMSGNPIKPGGPPGGADTLPPPSNADTPEPSPLPPSGADSPGPRGDWD
jgi:hypothetical protein